MAGLLTPREQFTLAQAKWHEKAQACKTAADRERLSTLMIKLAGGDKEGAHSEDPTVWHQRQIIRYEVCFSDTDPIGCEVSMPPEAMQEVIHRAAQAITNKHLQLTWALSEDGQSVRTIASKLGIGESAVYRRLARARTLIIANVSGDAVYLFYQQIEQHKRLHKRTVGKASARERKWTYGANGWE